MAQFKIGDEVELININKLDYETKNWITIDFPEAEIGQKFIVSNYKLYTIGHETIILEGSMLSLEHPVQKFKLSK